MIRLKTLSADSRTAGSTLGTSVAVLVLNLFGGILLARGLGVEGRGQVAALVLWAAISMDVAMVGTNASTTYHVARHRPDRARIVSLLAHATPFMALVGVALFVVLAMTSSQSLMITAIAVFGVYVPARIAYEQVIAFVQGNQRFTRYNLSRVLLAGAQTAFFALTLLQGALTVSGAGIGYITGLIAGLGVLAVGRRRRSDDPPPTTAKARFELPGYWSYALRNWLAVLAARGNSSVDIFILSLLAATSTVGLYAVSVSAASVLTLAGTAAGIVALPRLAAARHREEAAAVYRELLAFTLLGTVVMATLLLVSASWLVPLVFGEDFRTAVPIVRTLAVGYIGVSLAKYAAAVLRSRDRPGMVAIAQAVGGGVTLTIALALDPTSGVTVALASAIGFWSAAVIQLVAAGFVQNKVVQTSVPTAPHLDADTLT